MHRGCACRSSNGAGSTARGPIQATRPSASSSCSQCPGGPRARRHACRQAAPAIPSCSMPRVRVPGNQFVHSRAWPGPWLGTQAFALCAHRFARGLHRGGPESVSECAADALGLPSLAALCQSLGGCGRPGHSRTPAGSRAQAVVVHVLAPVGTGDAQDCINEGAALMQG